MSKWENEIEKPEESNYEDSFKGVKEYLDDKNEYEDYSARESLRRISAVVRWTIFILFLIFIWFMFIADID